MRRTRLSQYPRETKGSVIVEFAVIFPLMVTLISVVIDISMVFIILILVHNGLSVASRFGWTGQGTSDGNTRKAQIVEIVREKSFGLVSPAIDDLDIKVYPSFASIGEPEPSSGDLNGNSVLDPGEYTDVNRNGQWDEDQGRTDVGGGDEIVSYTLNFAWQLLTPFGALLNPQGEIQLSTSVAVRNEPF